MLSEKEKAEFLEASRSEKLREDCRILSARARTPVKSPNSDKILAFMSGYNAFINHARRPFKKIEGTNFKL